MVSRRAKSTRAQLRPSKPLKVVIINIFLELSFDILFALLAF